MDKLAACTAFLSLLPECRCEADALSFALSRFGLGYEAVEQARADLPKNYDLEYEGIRVLLSALIEEFVRIPMRADGRARCEVTVPCPTFLIMALQKAAGHVRFSSDALIAQIVLRSIFLHRQPVDSSCSAKRFCGLNRMREYLFSEMSAADYLLQFGVLCDECTKCHEENPAVKRVFSVTFPKGNGESVNAYVRRATENFISEICSALDIELTRAHSSQAIKQYAGIVRLENRLLQLNRRNDRKPMKGNSFALAQTVLLLVFDDWDKINQALETLVREYGSAEPADNIQRKRLYCFYTPFLYPEIDRLFRENDVDLIGSAVFLPLQASAGFSLTEMTVAWLHSLSVRAPAVEQGERIAKEIVASGCCGYLTGMFNFDRWMGPTAMIHTELLWQIYRIPSWTVDIDFWLESATTGAENLKSIIETISEVLSF